ncbi:hypothetical protein WDW89_24115 [Deltaproteobacteria bacterium TL4]
MMKTPLLQWAVEKNDTIITVALNGIINEEFDYKQLANELKEANVETLRLNLQNIRRINSMGIREWFNFLKEVAWSGSVVLSECSLIFTEVLSQIEEMGHGSTIESCYLPVWCNDCEEEFELRIDMTVSLSQQPQEVLCPDCSAVCPVEIWSIEEIIQRQTR